MPWPDWPDWPGETTVIVATGPSALKVPIQEVRGRARVIVIKRMWQTAPWADVLYGIDRGWWIANHGAPDFKGLKFSPSPTACRVFNLQQVRLKPKSEILTKERGVLGCGLRTGGGFSGFQAVNLAYQFGSRRVILVGYDMTLANGAHCHQDYRGVGKPEANRVTEWRKAFDGCSEHFRKMGLEVLNASPGSALKAYPMVDLGGDNVLGFGSQ